MEDQFQDSLSIQEKFESNIRCFSLFFKDERLESKYQIYKRDYLQVSCMFKFGLCALIFILAFRRIELLIFTLNDVESIASDHSFEYMQTALLIATFAFEGIVICVDCLKILRGCILMIYMFFTIFYSSYEYLPEKPAAVPMYFFIMIKI